MIRPLLRDQRGIGVPMVMIIIGLMLAIGLGSAAFVDGEQSASATDRVFESSFNLSEGVLSTQAYKVSTNWPGSAANPYPDCASDGSATANPDHCPQPDELSESYDGNESPDYAGDVEWSTTVRDDATGTFYDATQVENAASWDANANKQVWLRSQATVRGRTRTLVALFQVESINEVIPQRTIIAGKVATSNNGKKVIIDTGGVNHPVTVRCTPSQDPLCLDYPPNKGQISPPEAVETGAFVGQPALSAETVDRLERRAKADGTYYASGCPSTITGAVVFIEGSDSLTCQYQGETYNSPTSPGMVIMREGRLQFHSQFTYYGIVYLMNKQGSPDPDVFKIHANGTLRGAIFVDGGGGVDAGSDKFNIIYDDFTVLNVASYGTAGVVQNTWREVPSQ